MKRLILSTVGTSILTNGIVNNNDRSEIYNNSNCKNEIDCPESLIELVNDLKEKVFVKLSQEQNLEKIKRISAELNGIYGFYNKINISNQDLHFLITTDTYQGKMCGEILMKYLSNKNMNVNIYTPHELTTRTKYNFEQGIKNLLKWCDETLLSYKDSGYEIIFNLTGSFKSLQGYMNTIAMFYADKIIYIFESEKAELIEIPKLPIDINYDIIDENKEKILLMSVGYNCKENEIKDLPKTIVDELEDNYFLSVWGELIWNKTKNKILTKELIQLPHLIYSDIFKKNFNNATEKDRIKLQETLAKVSKILLETDFDIKALKRDGGLQYDNYNNTTDENNITIGHFRITQGDRVSCVVKGNKLYLRKFGRHDFVNDKP